MSIFPLFTYDAAGNTPTRKKVTPADATSTVGVDRVGYFTPADVWKVTLEDLGNAFAINSTLSYSFISQKKQLNNARIALLYNTGYSPTEQMVWCQLNDSRTGPIMQGIRQSTPPTPANGVYTNHVFRPNYDSITPGGYYRSNSTDGLGIWNGIADRPYDMLRLWFLPTSIAIADSNSANGLINRQGGTPDHLWWNFATYARPLNEIQANNGNRNAYGDVFTFEMNDDNQAVGLYSTRVDTDDGTWRRYTNMEDGRFNWTLTSWDNVLDGQAQPFDGVWWHQLYTRPATFNIAQAVARSTWPKKFLQFSVVVLDPSPYMKVYYCLANSQNTEAKMNALVGNFANVIKLVFPNAVGDSGVTVEDVIEICVLLDWYTANGKITLTANTLVGSFIANDASPRNYANLDSNVRALIRTFAQQAVEMPNINLDQPYLRFASNQFSVNPVNLLQTFPELGCYMPPTYMDTYWRTLRAQLTIPVGLQRPECFFAPCTSNANTVKTAALLRASGQVVSCGPLISCVNITNTTVTNSGQIVGDVSVLNTTTCQAAYTEAKDEAKNDPGGGGSGGGGSGGGGGGGSSGSSGLDSGEIAGIVIGVVVVVLALGLGIGLGLANASAKSAAAAAATNPQNPAAPT